jgi:hypothetical protein
MEDATNRPPGSWTGPPTSKQRNAAQRAFSELLDELAPERAAPRTVRLPGRIEQHRTPSGCVLQAATAAVSVSWFPDAADNAPLGELHVLVWRGVVTRRGSGRGMGGAVVTRQLTLRPIADSPDECVWRAADGTTYDTAGLAAHCLALLEEEIAAADPASPPA